MAVTLDLRYDGDLRCTVTHGPSGTSFRTDAPTDNRGQGRSISPTDLAGAAMASCMLTIMGIAALDRGIDLEGVSARVTKEMNAVPRRHISRVTIEISLPASLGDRERRVMRAAAEGCPVAASMGPDTEVALSFRYV